MITLAPRSARNAISLLLLLVSLVECSTVKASDLSVGGVGSGVVAIIVFLIIGILICIYGRCTAIPYIYAIIGTILPVIVAIIIYYLPKQSERPKRVGSESEPTSWIPVLRWIFAGFTYLMTVVALLCLFILFCAKPFAAYRVGTDTSSLISHSSMSKSTQLPATISRDKVFEKPKVDAMKLTQRTRHLQDGVPVGPTDEQDEGAFHRRRKDIIPDIPLPEQGLLAPEGMVRDTGMNQVRPGRLPPIDRQRQLDMGVEIHNPPVRRRLNMVNPDERTVAVDHVRVDQRRIMDSDDED